MIRVIGVLAELHASFQLPKLLAFGALQSRAQRIELKIVCATAVVVTQIINVSRMVLDCLVTSVQSHEFLVIVRTVEIVWINSYRSYIESIQVPVLSFVKELITFERAPRVGPIQRRDESLVAVEQLLTSGPQPQFS